MEAVPRGPSTHLSVVLKSEKWHHSKTCNSTPWVSLAVEYSFPLNNFDIVVEEFGSLDADKSRCERDVASLVRFELVARFDIMLSLKDIIP